MSVHNSKASCLLNVRQLAHLFFDRSTIDVDLKTGKWVANLFSLLTTVLILDESTHMILPHFDSLNVSVITQLHLCFAKWHCPRCGNIECWAIGHKTIFLFATLIGRIATRQRVTELLTNGALHGARTLLPATTPARIMHEDFSLVGLMG
jgi:hypothetical protein